MTAAATNPGGRSGPPGGNLARHGLAGTIIGAAIFLLGWDGLMLVVPGEWAWFCATPLVGDVRLHLALVVLAAFLAARAGSRVLVRLWLAAAGGLLATGAAIALGVEIPLSHLLLLAWASLVTVAVVTIIAVARRWPRAAWLLLVPGIAAAGYLWLDLAYYRMTKGHLSLLHLSLMLSIPSQMIQAVRIPDELWRSLVGEAVSFAVLLFGPLLGIRRDPRPLTGCCRAARWLRLTPLLLAPVGMLTWSAIGARAFPDRFAAYLDLRLHALLPVPPIPEFVTPAMREVSVSSAPIDFDRAWRQGTFRPRTVRAAVSHAGTDDPLARDAPDGAVALRETGVSRGHPGGNGSLSPIEGDASGLSGGSTEASAAARPVLQPATAATMTAATTTPAATMTPPPPESAGPGAAAARPNLVVLWAESLRADVFASVMSRTRTVAERHIWARQHHASSNFTIPSMVAFRYGFVPIDPPGLFARGQPTVWYRFLRDRGYRLLRFEAFHDWVTEPSLQDMTLRTWQLDPAGYQTTARVLSEILAELDRGGPSVIEGYLFNTHWDYYFPPEHAVFQPILDQASADMYRLFSTQPTPELLTGLRNRYRNAAYHLDHLLADFIGRARAAGHLDRTVLVILGDHGESLGEAGFISHSTGPMPEQFLTPCVIITPDGWRQAIDTPSDNTDLIPTLGRFLDYDVDGLAGIDLLAARRTAVTLVDTSSLGRLLVRDADAMSIFSHWRGHLRWQITTTPDYVLDARPDGLYSPGQAATRAAIVGRHRQTAWRDLRQP